MSFWNHSSLVCYRNWFVLMSDCWSWMHLFDLESKSEWCITRRQETLKDPPIFVNNLFNKFESIWACLWKSISTIHVRFIYHCCLLCFFCLQRKRVSKSLIQGQILKKNFCAEFRNNQTIKEWFYSVSDDWHFIPFNVKQIVMLWFSCARLNHHIP